MGIVLELLALGLISAAVGCVAPVLYYRAKARKTSTRWVLLVEGEFARTEDLLPGTTLNVKMDGGEGFVISCKKPDYFELRFPPKTVIQNPSKYRVVEL